VAFDILDRFWKETRDRVSGIDYDNNEVLLSGNGLPRTAAAWVSRQGVRQDRH